MASGAIKSPSIKDKGYINENNEFFLNEHAHMEFVTLDERGINRQRDFGKYLNGQKILSQIQDDVAKMLNMHRGISVKKSKTKRIEPRVLASIKQKEQNSKTEQKTFYELMIKNAKNKSKELKEFYERKLKDEEAKNEKIVEKDIFENIINDLGTLLNKVTNIKEEADKQNMYATSSLMDEYIEGYMKKLWMCRQRNK